MTARSPSRAVDRLGVVLRQPSVDDLDAVLTVHADPVIGFAGVRTMTAGDLQLFNLYHRLAPNAWGRGIAGCVAREAVAGAHDGWPNRPIIARMQPGHAASLRAADLEP